MTRTLLAVLASALLFGLFASSGVTEEKKKTKKDRFFELRIYTTNDGKLDDLHKRFKNHTNGIFKKSGMELIAYWTPTDGEEAKNTLIYVLAYPDRASRDKSWALFRKDPEWRKAFKESRKDGPLVKKVVSKFMTPTDYSPIK